MALVNPIWSANILYKILPHTGHTYHEYLTGRSAPGLIVPYDTLAVVHDTKVSEPTSLSSTQWQASNQLQF